MNIYIFFNKREFYKTNITENNETRREKCICCRVEGVLFAKDRWDKYDIGHSNSQRLNPHHKMQILKPEKI